MSSDTTQQQCQKRRLRPLTISQLDNKVECSETLDLDEWDCDYKLDKGKRISRPIYAGLPQRDPIPPVLQAEDPTPKKHASTGPTPYGVSKWHDPEPDQPVVDVKDDSEFYGGLKSTATLRTQPSHPSAFCSRPLSPPTSPKEPLQKQSKPRQKKIVKPSSALEEVVREMFASRKETPSSSIEICTHTREKPLSDSRDSYEQDAIKLCSLECDDNFVFPRRIIALSGKFSQLMKEEGFDGVITTTEGKEAMDLLGAWMSRDLKFEISVTNCECLLRLASTYDITCLLKDVLPALINLPLHPFEAYNYGKLYSIPALSRLNADHVMDNFGEYVDTHFKDLVVACPDEGVELVKRYLQLQAIPGGRVECSSPASNRFRKWLAEETP